MTDLAQLQQHIETQGGERVIACAIAHDELTVTVKRDAIVEVLTMLRNDPLTQLQMLADVCGVDYPSRPERFEVVYNLLSVSKNHRIRVALTTDERTPVPSVIGVYPAAAWYEREAWDLYGIVFAGNTDLRRLLTDYGFEGHPLRKDFPLTGFVEVRYDAEQKRVVYDAVKLPQDFRNFDYLSPWEGMDKLLPGDEKAGVVHQPIGSNGKKRVG